MARCSTMAKTAMAADNKAVSTMEMLKTVLEPTIAWPEVVDPPGVALAEAVPNVEPEAEAAPQRLQKIKQALAADNKARNDRSPYAPQPFEKNNYDSMSLKELVASPSQVGG